MPGWHGAVFGIRITAARELPSSSASGTKFRSNLVRRIHAVPPGPYVRARIGRRSRGAAMGAARLPPQPAPSSKMLLLLVRHAQSENNALLDRLRAECSARGGQEHEFRERYAQAKSSDPGLSELGARQAARCAEWIQRYVRSMAFLPEGYRIELVSSPMERALRTAEALAKQLPTQVISYFLVFVRTIREIRDFYREMQRTNRESVNHVMLGRDLERHPRDEGLLDRSADWGQPWQRDLRHPRRRRHGALLQQRGCAGARSWLVDGPTDWRSPGQGDGRGELPAGSGNLQSLS
eukprot:SAG31_NODE_1194_length_9448_cov_9.896887_3_plen_294_part_00